jgi:hypothetical protein
MRENCDDNAQSSMFYKYLSKRRKTIMRGITNEFCSTEAGLGWGRPRRHKGRRPLLQAAPLPLSTRKSTAQQPSKPLTLQPYNPHTPNPEL